MVASFLMCNQVFAWIPKLALLVGWVGLVAGWVKAGMQAGATLAWSTVVHRLWVGAVQTGIRAQDPALEGRPPQFESQLCLLLPA